MKKASLLIIMYGGDLVFSIIFCGIISVISLSKRSVGWRADTFYKMYRDLDQD